MKRIFFLMAAASCLSARSQTTALQAKNESDPQIAAIQSVYQQIVKSAEDVDADRLITYFSKSPKVQFITEQTDMLTGYKTLHEVFRNAYSHLSGQTVKTGKLDVQLIGPNHAVATALATFKATVKESMSDSSADNWLPVAWTFVFVREDGSWKVLHCHQSIKR